MSILSLLTYNIHKGFALGSRRFVLPEMQEALQQLNPDVLLLQEVQGEHLKRAQKIAAWPTIPQVAYLAGGYWPYYVYAQNAVYEAGHHGNAIISRYPFLYAQNRNFSTLSRASRSVLHTLVQFDNGLLQKNIHVLCVHMGLFKNERETQYQALIDYIQQGIPEQESLILAGDFNDWRHDFSIKLAHDLRLVEGFIAQEGKHARSYPSIRPALCVDRIYYRGVELVEVECLSGTPWHRLSDHLPLYARFSLGD